ncbi:hypothetical protein KY285_000948 [Solanum tuberosum]|nr:hypothetical protein KY285_000948 [Solanum tuberosum]
MKEFPCLTPGCKLNLVESLRSNISVLLRIVDSLWRVSLKKDGNVDEEKNDSEEDECSLADRVASSQNAFQIYTFFLIHIVLIDKSKSSSNNITKLQHAANSKAEELAVLSSEPLNQSLLPKSHGICFKEQSKDTNRQKGTKQTEEMKKGEPEDRQEHSACRRVANLIA